MGSVLLGNKSSHRQVQVDHAPSWHHEIWIQFQSRLEEKNHSLQVRIFTIVTEPGPKSENLVHLSIHMQKSRVKHGMAMTFVYQTKSSARFYGHHITMRKSNQLTHRRLRRFRVSSLSPLVQMLQTHSASYQSPKMSTRWPSKRFVTLAILSHVLQQLMRQQQWRRSICLKLNGKSSNRSLTHERGLKIKTNRFIGVESITLEQPTFRSVFSKSLVIEVLLTIRQPHRMENGEWKVFTMDSQNRMQS